MNIFLFSVVSSCVFFHCLLYHYLYALYFIIIPSFFVVDFIFCPCYNYLILIFNATFIQLIFLVLATDSRLNPFPQSTCACTLLIILSATRLLFSFARNSLIFVIVNILTCDTKTKMKRKQKSISIQHKKN